MHRDIKPDNMLLSRDGSLLLNDNDVSCTRLVGSQQLASRHTSLYFSMVWSLWAKASISFGMTGYRLGSLLLAW